MSIFWLLGGNLPTSTEFPSKVWGKGQGSPNMVGATSKMKGGGTFLVRWRIQAV